MLRCCLLGFIRPVTKALVDTLTNWVTDNGLQGKSISNMPAAKGSCGIILSKSGCIYHGVDISPTAVEKSKIGASRL